MPTHKRSRPSSTQKTLPFTNSTKISKANHTPSTHKSKNPPTNPSKPTTAPPLQEPPSSTPAPPSSTTPNSPPKPKPKPKPAPPLETHHHALASQTTPAQIRKYWQSREALRLAPRVHQKDVELGEKVLREWDCMSQFGPAIGIARTQRWHRAARLGLNPPIEVLAVLVGKEGEKGAGERAYVDELMK
ncbi:hypothetical protein MFRU_006g02070 [Monilinia fructicola]|nr:hypothetical protein MFRU_006g02070 [Monilinia fructicola]